MYGEEPSVSLYDDGKESEKGLLLTSLYAFASLLDFAKGELQRSNKGESQPETMAACFKSFTRALTASGCFFMLAIASSNHKSFTRASQELQLQTGCFLLAIASSIHKEAE